jgi:hypothetical protein
VLSLPPFVPGLEEGDRAGVDDEGNLRAGPAPGPGPGPTLERGVAEEDVVAETRETGLDAVEEAALALETLLTVDAAELSDLSRPFPLLEAGTGGGGDIADTLLDTDVPADETLLTVRASKSSRISSSLIESSPASPSIGNWR